MRSLPTAGSALVAYGGECTRCHGKDEDSLEFHHEDGGGNEHRDELFGYGHDSPGGWMFCLKLKQLGYPQDLGLSLLCKDCHDLEHGRAKKEDETLEPLPELREYAMAGSDAAAIW